MSDINQTIDINEQTTKLIETLIERIKLLEDKLAKIEHKQVPNRVYVPNYDYSHLNLKEQCYY
jgi:hypothetical protein